MTRGEGSLFVATRAGVAMLGIAVRAVGRPTPTWWAHLCGCAWTAAWLTARGRALQGCREVLVDPVWAGTVRWHDHKGAHRAGHRPDLACVLDGGRVAIEVELAQKSTERLRAIPGLHARWRASGTSSGVLYVCGDQDGRDRIRTTAGAAGLLTAKGGGLRVELLETIRAQTLVACEANRMDRVAGVSGG